ncbi:hypothetical protein RclHR1_36720001 [Rhizophagus clarus]|uniref:Uncharacterized protein n=1 Tax=Rhizophagus clarus TaxID=94130 RepID=A0A2Z6S6Z1_9GLOM|nr:hypothetical protein RclHR1_36720001 [Rhizophagus clarus]
MLRAAGCTEITLFSKDQSEYEFWSRNPNLLIDQNTLENLYRNGFLNIIPTNVFNSSNQFWKCFQKSLEENKKDHDGKIRILSIIANDFEYEELQKNLKVSSKIVAKAKYHCEVNGPGCAVIDKPIITRVRITEEMEKQFQNFFADKNIVNLSSYRVDTKTGEPLKYLKDQKETLWQKYFELYPTGMKRTTFLARLKDGPYVYREDLGGLCGICSEYGYGVFDDLRTLIIERISEKERQVV